MPDEVTEGELSTAAEIDAARAAFLSAPPEILDPNEPAAVDTTAEENALLDELSPKPPAAPEGATATAPSAPAPAPAPTGTSDPYAQWGGEEAVRTAMAVQEALRTENGLRALVANGLVELGYSVDQVRTALDSFEPEQQHQQQQQADPFAGLEDDDVVTVAQTRQLIAQAAQYAAEQAVAATQQQLAPVEQIIAEQQQTAVRTTTDQAVVELLGPIPTEAAELAAYQRQVDAIVDRGLRYYDPNQWNNPAHIRYAVAQAHAELNAEAEQRFQDHLAAKRKVRDSQPPNIGGGAGVEGALPEPKNLDEARQQARAAGFFG